MMSEPDYILVLRRRKDEIISQRQGLAREENAIDAVINIYLYNEQNNRMDMSSSDDVDEPHKGSRTLPTVRPSGLPTNIEMFIRVLADAEKQGKESLTSSEIIAAIADRFWPGLTYPQILPSLHSAAKSRRGIEKLPNKQFRRIRHPSETSEATRPHR